MKSQATLASPRDSVHFAFRCRLPVEFVIAEPHRDRIARSERYSPPCASLTVEPHIDAAETRQHRGHHVPKSPPGKRTASDPRNRFKWNVPLPRLFEFIIQRYLKSVCQTVIHVGHTDHAHQFPEHGLGHTFGDRGRAMRRNAVVAAVGHADGNINQFTDQRIQFAGPTHDFLERLPSPLECGGMIGDGLPEVIDFCRFAGCSDVVKDFSHDAAAVFVFNQRLNGDVS